MTELRSVIVGGGAVGADFHVPRLLKILNCSSVCIVDNNDDRCSQLRRKFAANEKISVSTTIPSATFDLAVVATPPKFHLSVFQTLVDQCQSFLIEKPLTKTLAEGGMLVKQAEAKRRKVYVALIRRSLGHFTLVKEWIRQDLFGALKSVHIAEGSVFSWNAVSQGSFSKELNGGGVLMDTGPHTVDQLFQVFDTVTFQRAKMDALPKSSKTAIEANVYLKLEADGRIPVSLMLSRNRYLSNQAVFEFEKADLCLSLHNNTVKLMSITGHNLIGFPVGFNSSITYHDLFDSFYNKFLLKQDNDEVNPKEALKSQAIIEQAYVNAELIKGGF